MDITPLILGDLRTNCYFLTIEKQCLIIDPADSADFLLEKIQRENLELIALVATHGHFDHVIAVGEIQLSFNVPFYVDKRDEFLIKRTDATAQHFLGYNPHSIAPHNIHYFSQHNKKITIGPFSFDVIHTPGHTPGGVSLYNKIEKIVFTGDTLFKNAIGRYDLSYSRKDDLIKSFQILMDLPVETIVYPGHGETTTIGEEKKRY